MQRMGFFAQKGFLYANKSARTDSWKPSFEVNEIQYRFIIISLVSWKYSKLLLQLMKNVSQPLISAKKENCSSTTVKLVVIRILYRILNA